MMMMTDIKHSQEINWKSDIYSMNVCSHSSKEIDMTSISSIKSENTEKEESDSLSGYSDEENHKQKRRRYR
jgi:hypothetical protein